MLLTSRQRLTSLLCLIYFTTLLITPDSYKYGAILLAVTALIMLPSTWQSLKTRPAILISGSLVLYFVVTLAFALPGEHYEQLDMPSRVLLAIMIFALLLKYPPELKSVFYGCAIGAALVGVIALYQHYMLDIRALSTGGFMPIQVAGMAASLSVFSILAYIYSCQHTLPTLKKIAFLGITLGFIATLLSGGRGSWVLTPFVALWAVIYYRKHFGSRDYLAIATSIVLIVATAVIPALDRAELVLTELSDYQQIQNTENQGAEKQNAEMAALDTQRTPSVISSSGIRVELWKTALYLFADNPLTGTGYSQFTSAREVLVEKGQVDTIVMDFSRAHNQLLEELQVKGLIGGLTLIVLIAAPWLATRKTNTGDTPDKYFATIMLRSHLILIAGYMLTQHYLNHHSGILFFSLGVVIFASIALRAEARD